MPFIRSVSGRRVDLLGVDARSTWNWTMTIFLMCAVAIILLAFGVQQPTVPFPHVVEPHSELLSPPAQPDSSTSSGVAMAPVAGIEKSE